MLTIHAGGGPAMVAAAAEAAGESDSGPAVLASYRPDQHGRAQLEATGVSGSAAEQVERLASMALACGVQGFVCSAVEVAGLRSRLGSEPLLVIPGIRPEGAATAINDVWRPRRGHRIRSELPGGRTPHHPGNRPGRRGKSHLAEMQAATATT